MSTRPRIKKFPVIVQGDMAAVSITSAVTIIEDLTVIGYSLWWSASSPVGDLAVQVSNDYALASDGRTVANAGTWTPITVNYNGTPVQAIRINTSSGTGFIDITSTGAYAIRLVYTRISGNGDLESTINAKVA